MPTYYPSLALNSLEDPQESINDFLQRIGSTMKVTRKYIQKLQNLNLILPTDKEHFVTQVDDELTVIENLAPEMIFATRGKLAVILHMGENLSEIVHEVLATKATTILMDYKLNNDITGAEVTKKILEVEPDIKILGFSSNKDRRSEFLNEGASGFVHKNADEQEETMWELIAELTRIGAQ